MTVYKTGEKQMGGAAENLTIAKRHLKAVESGASGEEIAQLFAPEVVVEVFPRLYFSHACLPNR